MKKLYFGDCLDILKELHAEHPEGFIDLIYIDPPFNSKRDYNILFESVDLTDATAQKQAFADTWSNVSYLDALNEIQSLSLDLHQFLTVIDGIGYPKGAVAYLTTMAIRLYFMHKVLKETGSFYLHCDPTMSHYLKLELDLIFGEKNFRNEIIWRRSPFVGSSKNRAQFFAHNHDVILFYSKSNSYGFNQKLIPYTEEYKVQRFKNPDNDPRGPWQSVLLKTYSQETLKRLKKEGGLIEGGKQLRYKFYLADSKGGRARDDVWSDPEVMQINPVAKERLGYPTQKPQALLERIIEASSHEGDLVADFFCGCGTTIAAAEHLNRNWIGADISHLAIKLIVKRLTDPYRRNQEKFKEILQAIHISGLPKDIASAKELACNTEEGRFGFQDWVVEVMLGGVCNPKKTADGGWDGYLTFNKTEKEKEIVLVEVKSGNVNVKNLREFMQVVDARKAAVGTFVCFQEQVTKPMLLEAKRAGYYDKEHWGDKYDKIQIITVEDLLEGRTVETPESTVTTFKATKKSSTKKHEQTKLFD